MAVCLSGRSAELALEAFAREGVELEPVSASCLGKFSANIDDVRDILGGLHIDDPPLHLLVGKPVDRRSSSAIAASTTSINLPDGAIKRADEGLYVVSPEFCLLQRATEAHLVNVCQTLGRFMATKVRASVADRSLVDRSPLTSVQRVNDFLSSVGNVRGSRALREALRWTAPAAASAQEVDMQLQYSLPPQYGGYDLGLPKMNDEVTLEGVAKSLLPGHKHIYIDLSWPELKIGCEYQGEQHRDQIDSDCSRELAAEAMGYKLWYIAKTQLYSSVHMGYIALQIARAQGKRTARIKWPSQEQVEWLQSVLQGHTHPKPGFRFVSRRRKA